MNSQTMKRMATYKKIYSSGIKCTQFVEVSTDTAMADQNGALAISRGNYTVVGHVGEDGIKADTLYRLGENHEFVEAKESEQ